MCAYALYCILIETLLFCFKNRTQNNKHKSLRFQSQFPQNLTIKRRRRNEENRIEWMVTLNIYGNDPKNLSIILIIDNKKLI